MDNTSGVKRFFEYLPACVKFHKLRNERLPRLIFAIILIFQMAGDFIQYNILKQIPSEQLELLRSAIFRNPNSMVISGDEISFINSPQVNQEYIFKLFIMIGVVLAVKLIVNLFLSVYMYAYISELKGKNLSISQCFKGAFKHFGRLVAYNVLFGLVVFLGLTLLVLPGIAAYAMFVFGYCYVLDLKLRASDAFSASIEITKGQKIKVARVLVGFYLLFDIPISIFFSGQTFLNINLLIVSGASFGQSIIASFFGTIVSMILQRLIVQMYFDLEYKRERLDKKV